MPNVTFDYIESGTSVYLSFDALNVGFSNMDYSFDDQLFHQIQS